MILTKKLEAEIVQVYETWLHSYLNGDVATYDSYFDEEYHFIGSTDNEEFLNRKDTTNFFRQTADQLAGKTQLRNETKFIEKFEELVFITHLFDAWFLNGTEWNYYGRFRFSNALKQNKEGWRFIYQHFSTTDSKADDGETIGFDKVNAENQELREAIKRRTFELEVKNRELEIEGALQRIRAQAVAMKQSSDLLEIVVSMRNEFTKLGHKAHYFWHMMWLPEKYEKAMTSGDGTKIGFVMELPRHIHGDIPLLAKWEKSKKPTVVYAMNVEEAIDYVDKMVALGDFKNIDPQAPSHDDIRHINGLTFIMARTSHGEIGYSLPGIVKNPPKEDIDILVKFAVAFDLAHRRFLDLQKAEKQAREVQIELALEKVRSRTMAMQHSDELADASFLLDCQIRALGIKTRGCAFNIYGENDSTEWFSSEMGTMPTYKTPRENIFLRNYEEGQKGKSMYIHSFSGEACAAHYEYLCTLPVMGEALKEFKKSGGSFPTQQIDHVTYFKYGYLLFITLEPVPEAHDIFKRFAKVFEQTYTRFLDLQKAEAQAKEAQIEAALERIRSRSMAMQKSSELLEAGELLWNEITKLGIDCFTSGYVLMDDMEDIGWNYTPNPSTGKILEQAIGIPHKQTPPMRKIAASWKAKEPMCVIELIKKQTIAHQTFVAEKGINFPFSAKQLVEISPEEIVLHTFNFKQGYLLIVSGETISKDQSDLMLRFTKVFQQTYTRFLDLKKAEAQAREAQIETALERVRSKSIGMQKSTELAQVVLLLDEELNGLGIEVHGTQILTDFDNPEKSVNVWFGMKGQDYLERFHVPYFDHPVRKKFHNAWKKGIDFYTEQYSKTDKNKFFRLLVKNSDFRKITEERQKFIYDSPGFTRASVLFKNSILIFQRYNLSEFLEEEVAIFKRFSKVFEQAYTRFIDLQKAEAQAREVQIEFSLERVRSQAMAMRKSEDLVNCTRIVFDELEKLNLSIERSGIGIFDKETKDCQLWTIVINKEGKKELATGVTSLTVHPMLIETFHAWENQKPYSYILEGKELKAYYKLVTKSEFILPEELIEKSASLPKEYYHYSPFRAGGLYFFSDSKPVDEEKQIIRRFAEVFDMTYTRFLDLQKAEAQVREAKIEAALEKVRSRTMAMQKGEEVKDVVVLLYKELIALGVTNFATCGYVEINEKTNKQATWVTSPGGDSLGLFHLPLTGDVHFDARYKAWKKQQTVFHQTVAGKERKKHLEYAITTFNSKEAEEMVRNQFPDPTVFYCFNFSHGYLHLVCGSYLNKEEESLLARFTRVFEQTYARFLDLEKAEAQVREAQIEGALERVRSKTMAMYKSEDLDDIVISLFEEILNLGLEKSIRCGIGILEGYERMETRSVNSKSDGTIDLRVGMLNMNAHPMLANIKKSWENGSSEFSYEFKGKDVKKYYEALNNEPEYPFNVSLKSLPKQEFQRGFFFSSGILFAFSEIPFSEELSRILARFAAVFGQTYRRFLDLKKAESQAREAKKQASLDRVRGQIASMRSTADLDRITPLLWNELTTMDVPFIRCGVFIMDEPAKIVEVHLSAPDGHSLAIMSLPFSANPLTKNAIAYWHRKKVYRAHWNRKEFLDFMKSMMELGQVQSKETFQGAANPPESLDLHFIPFTQGMLYVGSENPLNDKQIELVQSLADAFAMAYARYEDFTKLEKAKRSVETTLSELKATQNQLIQSEKMASLGELTAGIAHEIQNPLNFVNNFSEVSNELIDEMNQEIDKGDLEEAKFIANDIKQNLEKINHHGKRADAIVKGMLQHSRSSKAEKEPTDINKLADEYLRLAYHGLRAKDKSFNATLTTNFDENIGTINVVPQDIGRVMLNLINNAFYAVDEKKKSGIEGYEPTVTVSTTKKEDKIEISVKDNGNGIPDHIKEKIFQPFFTTKPTGSGTGLGLSLSYDIVKAHGGELKVETKEGEGTMFIISLP